MIVLKLDTKAETIVTLPCLQLYGHIDRCRPPECLQELREGGQPTLNVTFPNLAMRFH